MKYGEIIELLGTQINTQRNLGEEVYSLTDAGEGYEGEAFKLETMKQVGGYEGAGEVFELILKLTRKSDGTEAYLQVDGEYSSYSGVEFYGSDTLTVVEPKQVTVIQYVKKVDAYA